MKPNESDYCPPVSIIILTYNGAEYILPLLASLSQQKYPLDQMEVIVVDNASTDQTVELVKNHYEFVKVVTLATNLGFAAGNNHGLLHANHEFLMFINQDTICHPQFVRMLVAQMMQDISLAACNPNIIPMDKERFRNTEQVPKNGSLHVYDLSPYGYGTRQIIRNKQFAHTKLLSGCAFIMRNHVIQTMGYLFDDQFWMYAEDTELSLRLLGAGHKFGAARDAYIFHFHKSDIKANKKTLSLAADAISNRVYAFYKNMTPIEFLLFLPLLTLGGAFKIFEFTVPAKKKIFYFVPFALFSICCMVRAILNLNKLNKKRAQELRPEPKKRLAILKTLLKR